MAREAFEGACGPSSVAEPGVGEVRGKLEWLRSTPSWALSAGLHLVLVLVLLTVVTEGKRPAPPEGGTIDINVRAPDPLLAPEPPRYDPEAERGTQKVPQQPVPLPRDDLPAFTPTLDPEPVPPEIEKGISPEQTSDRLLDFSGVKILGNNDTIGTGPGAVGPRGRPDGDEPAQGRPGEGRSPPSEDAVRAALEWLRRHQSDDGSWKSRDFVEKCKRPCRNAAAGAIDAAGRGFQQHDVGVTGLALLAFTGWGHTHRVGTYPEYRECVRKAIHYLLRVQVRSENAAVNGRLGPGDGEQCIYGHAIATMALSEVLLLSGDVILLKRPVTDAVKLCLLARNDGAAWRYGIKPGDNDTSVTGWMVLALKTAKAAKLDIPRPEFDQALGGALAWFHRVTSASGKAGYFVPGDEGSRLSGIHPEPYPFSKDLSSMTAVSVLCRLFAGESRQTKEIRDGVKVLMKELPTWREPRGRALSRIAYYYWYYASYALFQFGGPEWLLWNEAMLKSLLSSQRRGATADEDGSWDPVDEWGPAGGRVYSTALGAMTLEVYYRFRRLQGGN